MSALNGFATEQKRQLDEQIASTERALSALRQVRAAWEDLVGDDGVAPLRYGERTGEIKRVIREMGNAAYRRIVLDKLCPRFGSRDRVTTAISGLIAKGDLKQDSSWRLSVVEK